MKDAPPLSGPWANALAQEIVETAIDIALGPQGLLAQYMEPYPFTTSPVTLRALLKSAPQEAGQKLAGLISDPRTQAEGVGLMRRYIDAMSKQSPPEEAPIGV